MSLFDNPAVRKAYEDRTYTDKQGQEWHRGLDGWFYEMSETSSLLIRHDDFVNLVIEENPAS